AAVGLTAPKAKVKTAPPPPAPTASKEPISLQSRLRERLLEPPEWRPPTLRMVLNTTSPSRRDAPLRTAIPGGTDADLEAPAGDYATLQPQQLGQAYQPDARLHGSMYTLLRNGYSLSLQQQQNVALVPISFDLPRGEFALHAESAGHYVIALHLSNPQNTSYGFHNKLQRLEFEQHVIPVITTLVQQDETIQSGATFVVPCLIQLDAGEWVSFYWYLQGGNVLFHALTVDKVG
ncbi:MAG: hypothetical protein JSV79_07430, partial [Armatimonadota bacterium]